MNYGLISSLDDETTKCVFKSKKINNVVINSQLGELAGCLKKGDVVYVINVNRFANVTQLLNFGRFCMQKGVLLRFVAQPYLDIADGKRWKNSTLRKMEKMRSIEMQAKNHLQQCMRMGNEGWNTVFRCVEIMNLEILAHTFSSDGLLKRSN